MFKNRLNLEKMISFFTRIDEKISSRPLLIAVRRGLTYMIPVMLLGSFALLFISLPIPAYQDMMKRLFGEGWSNVFVFVRDATFNILSLIMVMTISYSYVTEKNERSGRVSPLISAAVSLGSFVALIGISKEGFDIANFGVIGVFLAIVVAITSSMLFFRLTSMKALQIKAFTDGASAAFNYSLNSIIPAIITITVYAAVNQALSSLFDIQDIQEWLSALLSALFLKMGSTFWSGMLFVFFVHIFWFFGMHGSNILEPVAQSVFVTALTANQQLVSAGQAPTEIFTKTFFDTFVLMGGGGTMLCLICAIFITGKYKNQRRLAKLSALPVLFNINELMVFGVPIVLNPVYIVPFLFVPLILAGVSYLAVFYGLVPHTVQMVEWTTPIFLSGYISTGSVSGSLLQLFNLLLGILCYMPFVKLAEGVSDVHMRANLKRVYTTFRQSEERTMASSLLQRHDDIGNIARFLASDLEQDLAENKLALHYQPQVDYMGNVVGVEALLRWYHDSYGYIYPPLAIALAEEVQMIDKLGNWVFDTACTDLKKMNRLGVRDVVVSVNVSAMQLENENFIGELQNVIKKHQIDPQMLKIEITEQLALSSGRKILDQIAAIKAMGVKLAMDDFGMGHSSLMYLKEYDFNTIKLDGSLVRELLTNNNCRNIVSSIVLLGQSLNYDVIAEYVDEEEQIGVLHSLGCEYYQGFYFSKALPYTEMIRYVLNRNRIKDIAKRSFESTVGQV